MGDKDDYNLSKSQTESLATEETIVNDINEYQETDTDFENFYTLDMEGGYKEQMVRESEARD